MPLFSSYGCGVCDIGTNNCTFYALFIFRLITKLSSRIPNSIVFQARIPDKLHHVESNLGFAPHNLRAGK